MLTGALLFVSAVVSLWIVLAGVEAGFWFSGAVRLGLLIAGFAVSAALAFWWIALPLLGHAGVLNPVREEEVARLVGARYPDVSDRLVNMLQLADGRHSSASDDMLGAAVISLGDSVKGVDFDGVEDFRRPKQVLRVAVAPMVVLLAVLIAAPGPFLSASKRLLFSGTDFTRPDAFSLAVTPGDAQVLRGEALTIRVIATGSRLPSDVVVERRAEGEQRVESERVGADSTGSFSASIAQIRTSFRYRIVADDVATSWFIVTVVDRPVIERLRLTLDYPDYSRLPTRSLDPGVGDVTALRGTRVNLDLGFSGSNVRHAVVVHSGGRVDTLEASGSSATGSFRVFADGEYHIELRSRAEQTNAAPIRYRVRAIDDAPPTITIVSPEESTAIEESTSVPVVVRLSDDYGFRRLGLFYRLAESRFGDVTEQFGELDVDIPDPRQPTQDLGFEWQVARDGYTPVPGDVFEYYLTVWDNDAVSGFKAASTPTRRLVVPSLAEQLEQLHEAEDQVQDKLEELIDQSNEVRSRFDELRDELRQNPTPDWEDERQLESLQQRQQALEQSVDEVTEQTEEIAEQMREQGAVSEETMRLFEELQNVMEEINSDELQEAIEALREAMQNLDMARMQEALDDFDFQETQFQERMQRSLELLKNLRMRQSLEEIAELARELAEKQEEIRERTADLDERQQGGEADEESSAEERSQLAEEQEVSSEEMSDLEQRLDEVTQQMEEMRRAPTQGMEQLQEELDEQRIPERMQENAEQLRNNQLNPAMQGQQQMQQQLQNMQSQLGQMQQAMQGAQMQMDTRGVRNSLSDVLRLSEREEDLRTLVDEAGGDGPRLRELARSQVELADGLRVVTDSLVQLARRIPQMSSALQERAAEGMREMNRATTALSDRVPAQAAGFQRSAMMQVNELALLLSDLLASMSNPSSSGGASMEQMMQQMQQMAGDQQRLNEQIQQMLNDLAGQRLTRDMQERMRSLAAQQDAMRRQLKEMARNPELRGNALGDLDKIAEQMEETVRELERRRAGRRTVERQQEILTRLLEATRSMQERGREERRESRTGEGQTREGPEDLPELERLDALRRDLIQALDAGYAPDYEELIKRYFERLQEQAVGQD